jgi:hypothetical protein
MILIALDGILPAYLALHSPPVKGCLLAAIMILDYWLQDAYISSICITPMHVPSSGQQHTLEREYMLVARSVGASFIPGNSAGHAS